MNVTPQLKQRIKAAIEYNRSNFEGSDAAYAKTLDIHKSAYSQLKNGKNDNVISNASWISIAVKLGVQESQTDNWTIVETPVVNYIVTQLALCQKHSICGIFCDDADIGKSAAAKYYALKNKNVIYVDCSEYKTKSCLVRFIARELGLNHTGKYVNVFREIKFTLNNLKHKMLIILDEAGDLKYEAFLELKALWNATEGQCAWYMLGAVGLKKKIQQGILAETVGYSEIFRRYGSDYKKVMPFGTDDRVKLMKKMVTAVIKANMPKGMDISEAVIASRYSLTNIKTLVKKFLPAA